ncbi:MAG: molybdopterin-binding protein [Desulfurococcaceae archaeon]
MGREPIAVVIVVGTELLKGIVIDTNSHWLAGKLTSLGIEVKRIIVVPDSVEDIEEVVRRSIELADIVLITGGLGFTEDDVTLQGVAKALNVDLELNREALEMIRSRAGSLDHTRLVKAAFIPKGGNPLPNDVGISPGVFIKTNNKYIIVMPGVPVEMETMFQKHVEPMLIEICGRISKTITVITGHSIEAEVDERIKRLRLKYPMAYFKTHAEMPVRISVTITGRNEEEINDLLKKIVEDLGNALIVREIVTK